MSNAKPFLYCVIILLCSFHRSFSDDPSLTSPNTTSTSSISSPVHLVSNDEESIRLKILKVGWQGCFKIGSWFHLVVALEGEHSLPVQCVVETYDSDSQRVEFQSKVLSLPRSDAIVIPVKSGRPDAPLKVSVYEIPADDTDSDSKLMAASQVNRTQHLIVSTELLPKEQFGTLTNSPLETGSEHVTVSLKQSSFLLGCVGPSSRFDEVFSVSKNGGKERSAANRASFRFFHYEDPSELPLSPAGYKSLDVLVLQQQFQLSQRQSAALEEWVRLGGHLVIVLGEQTEAYLQSPIASWLPIQVSGTTKIRELSALESYIETTKPIRMARREIPVARYEIPDGVVLAEGVDSPLLTETAYGFGRITCSAVDLNITSLKNWTALPVLCRKLVLSPNTTQTADNNGEGNRISFSGITDLSTQIHQLHEEFPTLKRFTFWNVMGLLVGYLLLIGLIDYLLVHRLLKRPHLTWFTLPLFVLLATAGTMAMARNTANDKPLWNHTDLVDIDLSTNTVRGRAWMTLYSPDSQRYAITANVKPFFAAESPSALEVDSLNEGQNPSDSSAKAFRSAKAGENVKLNLNWGGVAEATFRGMYKPLGVSQSNSRYVISSNRHQINELPLNAGATKSLTATWSYRLSDQSLVHSDLASDTIGQLRGSVSHQLPVPLEDWLLVYRNRIFRSRTSFVNPEADQLKPGVPFVLDSADVYQRELRGYLTGTHAVSKRKRSHKDSDIEVSIIQKEFDVMNQSLGDLVRIVSFHRKTGGLAYTGLHNHLLSKLEMSRLIELDKAVLIGKISHSALEITQISPTTSNALKDSSPSETWIRIVIPVSQDSGEVDPPFRF